MTNEMLEKLAAECPESTSEIFRPNDYYGHAYLLKKYCGIDQEISLPGIYPHAISFRDKAWAAELKHPMPFFLLKSKLQSDVYSKYSDKPSWIIGAPNYYAVRLINDEVKEIQSDAKGTLILPAHSTHHLTNNYDFNAFVQYLKNLPEKYKPITICLGWRDIQLRMHEAYLKHGFECTTAGHMYDKDFFPRLVRIFASNKFAVTNHIGTSAFYAAAMDIPVNLYRQKIETKPARFDQPAHLLQEAQFKPYLPIVEEFIDSCKDPDEQMAKHQKNIAKMILGYEAIKEPEELRSLFESLWQKSEMKPFIKQPNYVVEGSFNDVIQAIDKQVRSYPRQTPGRLKIDGFPIVFADLHSFYHQAIQIFQSEIYGFKTEKDNPVILDCGAHVGLASIYFATKYPNSSIHAFEADPVIAKMLNENVNTLGLRTVNVHPQAVWVNEKGVCFNKSGDDSGFISDEEPESLERVSSIRLKQFIENQHVDLMKLDIEGAEYEVIKDCDEALANVKNIIIEVHKFRDNNGSLGDILGILEKNNFEYTFGDFHFADWLEPSLVPPFSSCKTNKYIITIFAWQHDDRKLNSIETKKDVERALKELNTGRNSKAILLIKKAIQEAPGEKALYYALAVAHAREENFFEAKKLLAQIPENNPIYDKASYLLEMINQEIQDKHKGE
ncbi:MAG: FkbM family methyltransferase [Desulfobacterales bacterium]|jgi:FkbM family methyltransferase